MEFVPVWPNNDSYVRESEEVQRQIIAALGLDMKLLRGDSFLSESTAAEVERIRRQSVEELRSRLSGISDNVKEEQSTEETTP